jgi:hypothetical protein
MASSYDRARRQQVDPNKVLTGEELGDALDLIEFREEIGWPPDRGPAMSERPLGRCTVCALMIPLRDNGEIETHYRNIGQCRGTGQPPDLRTDLERAEGWWREYVAPGSTETHLGVLLAEYDRRGELLAAREAELDELEAIVKAAFRLAESYDPHSVDEVDGDLLAALVREVRR